MNCPFCDDSNIHPRLIYKNNFVLAFPAKMNIVPGHTIICPLRHIARIDDLSDDELIAIKKLIIKLKDGLKKCLNAKGFNIAWNENLVVGQTVDHIHIHIVPRKIGDSGVYQYEPRKFLYRPGSRNDSSNQELKDITRLIKKSLE